MRKYFCLNRNCLSKAFINCLNKPSLIWKGGKKINDLFITFHKWFVHDVVFSSLNFISDRPILAYMFSSCSGIP